MSSPWKKKQPEVVADKVLKRAEVSKMARKLQDRLALAQFKTNRGWEDLTLDTIEPKVEEELRRRRPMSSGDFMSDSSSSTSNSDVPYSRSRAPLGSSPLKAPFFSDAVGSSRSSSGHRKRTYQNSFQHSGTSTGGSRKRVRSSPSGGRSLHTSFKNHPIAFSSPIKPRKQPHFTTSAGPDLSFFRGTSRMPDSLQSANYAATSDDEENTLPLHSFQIRSSPPRTPPPGRGRTDFGRRDNHKNGKSGQEGADLLLYLATSPSPANPRTRSKMMNPPQTPPPKNMALPSSMMTTPGTSGGGGFFSMFGGPHTPSQTFDFADFINVTPSPAQGHWQRTPAAKTPLNVGRKRLTFEDIRSPNPREAPSTSKHGNLGMPLGGDLMS